MQQHRDNGSVLQVERLLSEIEDVRVSMCTRSEQHAARQSRCSVVLVLFGTLVAPQLSPRLSDCSWQWDGRRLGDLEMRYSEMQRAQMLKIEQAMATSLSEGRESWKSSASVSGGSGLRVEPDDGLTKFVCQGQGADGAVRRLDGADRRLRQTPSSRSQQTPASSRGSNAKMMSGSGETKGGESEDSDVGSAASNKGDRGPQAPQALGFGRSASMGRAANQDNLEFQQQHERRRQEIQQQQQQQANQWESYLSQNLAAKAPEMPSMPARPEVLSRGIGHRTSQVGGSESPSASGMHKNRSAEPPVDPRVRTGPGAYVNEAQGPMRCSSGSSRTREYETNHDERRSEHMCMPTDEQLIERLM